VVAVLNLRSANDEAPRSRAVKIIYGVVGIAMAADIVGLIIGVRFVKLQDQGQLVLIGESIELGLFVVFWVLQSIRDWNEPDPRALSAP
jgi:hypothetical protein